MKPPVPPPVADPCLKLTRRAAAAPATFDATTEWRLAADLEALREREANLRRYEVRLRALQDRIERGGGEPVRRMVASSGTDTVNPVSGADTEELQSGWEKFHRAVTLLQAEQTQLREERLTLRADRAALEQRESRLVAREAAVLEREQALATAKLAEETKRAAAGSRGPWDAARSMFAGAKDT